jgi:lysozyme
MHLSTAGLELLKKSEGFRDRIYADVVGFHTIGFGHRLTLADHYPDTITLAEAESILASDVAVAEAAVARLVHVPLTRASSTLSSISLSTSEPRASPLPPCSAI